LTNGIVANVTNIGSLFGVYGVAYDSSNGDVYVANWGAATVVVISGATNSVIANIATPVVGPVDNAGNIAFDSANGNIYVIDQDVNPGEYGYVAVISGSSNKVLANIALPRGTYSFLERLAFDSANGDLYLTNDCAPNACSGSNSSSVLVISGSTNSFIASVTLPANSYPGGIAYDSANGDVYVIKNFVNDTSSSSVLVISGSTNSVIADTALPKNSFPSVVVFDPANGNLYVATRGGPLGNVYEISGSSNTIMGSASNPYCYAHDITYDTSNSNLYVACAAPSNYVAVFSTG